MALTLKRLYLEVEMVFSEEATWFSFEACEQDLLHTHQRPHRPLICKPFGLLSSYKGWLLLTGSKTQYLQRGQTGHKPSSGDAGRRGWLC